MLRRIVTAIALAVLAACAADAPATQGPYHVSLSVDSIALRAGDSIVPPIQVIVNGVAEAAESRDIRLASSDTGVIAVGPGDLLTAVGDGHADITVSLAADASVSVTRSVNVTLETLTSVALVAPTNMIPGDTGASIVTGTIRGARLIPHPASVVVTSRNSAVVALNGNQVVAMAAGSSWLVATASTGVSDSSLVTVAVGPPVVLTISPRVDALIAGQTVHPTFVMTDRRGNLVTNQLPVLSSSATAVAAVQPDGTVIANGGGVAMIFAQLGVAADTLRLTVMPAPAVLGRLVPTPDSVTLSPGGSVTIQVQAFDTHGNAMPLPALTWQSLSSNVTVSSSGVITAGSSVAASSSSVAVQLSSGPVSAQVHVAIVITTPPIVPPPPPPPPPLSDGGYVQIRWVGALPSAAIVAGFESARLRLNGLFNSFNGVAQIAINLPAGSCMVGSPALNESVPGIVLFAQVGAIDGPGGILGAAGPCLFRNGTWLPIVGSMQFDSADMSSMATNGTLNGVVLHEMMHTLGFGTIWGPTEKNEVASPNGTDPRYFGLNAQNGYAAVGGGTDVPLGVPVENTGGNGTRGSHWRESVFHSELMTGWADGGMQMSRVTVGALKDFGYDVDITRADPFSLGSASLLGSSLRTTVQIVEQTIAPIGVVGLDGRIAPLPGTIAH